MNRQVRNENLNTPLHRGATKELEEITDRLMNAKSSPIHDSGNSVIPPANAPRPKAWKKISGQWGDA